MHSGAYPGCVGGGTCGLGKRLRCILVHSAVALYPGHVGGGTRGLGTRLILRHTEKHTEHIQSTTAQIAFSIVHEARILKAIHAGVGGLACEQ